MLSIKDIKTIAEETGFPCAYHHFAEGESPTVPFLIFLVPGDNPFAADGTRYAVFNEIDFELYTDKKDPVSENKVEAVLNTHGFFFTKSEMWIESEHLYEVLYEMEE
ncbi:MAG: hypothetical protein WAR39_10855 [Prevotella sp.]|jgi:hypothetical protein